MIHTPLEQFSIISIVPLHWNQYYLSFTNSSLYMLLAVGLVSLLLYAVTMEGGRLVPGRWQSLVEMVYEFVVGLVSEQIGTVGRRFFPLIFTTFLFLLSTWETRFLVMTVKSLFIDVFSCMEAGLP